MCVYLVVKLIERERGVCLRTYYVERVSEREREREREGGNRQSVNIFTQKDAERESDCILRDREREEEENKRIISNSCNSCSSIC